VNLSPYDEEVHQYTMPVLSVRGLGTSLAAVSAQRPPGAASADLN
jgi:hypothetical protein